MRYERAVSRVLLISILITLLLNINFTIWSVAYFEGNLADQVRQEMQLIKDGGNTDSAQSELLERLIRTLSADITFIVGILFVFCSFGLLIMVRQPVRIFYPNTLVALSVRLND